MRVFSLFWMASALVRSIMLETLFRAAEKTVDNFATKLGSTARSKDPHGQATHSKNYWFLPIKQKVYGANRGEGERRLL